MADEKQVTGAKPVITSEKPKTRRVRALADGISVELACGRHFHRKRGDVFVVAYDAFAASWQEEITDGSKPLAPLVELPPTSLPPQYAPVPVQ